MKQEIDSRLGILIGIVGVLVLMGIGTYVWMRPTVTPVAVQSPAPRTVTMGAAGGPRSSVVSEKSRAMFESHQRTDEDRRALEEFRRNNPNASTRFRP